jgi:hypothetical protein
LRLDTQFFIEDFDNDCPGFDRSDGDAGAAEGFLQPQVGRLDAFDRKRGLGIMRIIR